MKKNEVGFPLTEALVFDIVDYLLDKGGYAFSNEISYHIVDANPRRYTSREVVGILRNRPMFQHAQNSDRRSGIKWRLNLISLEDYLNQKGYNDRAENRGFYERGKDLKEEHINKTAEIVRRFGSGEVEDIYEELSMIWV